MANTKASKKAIITSERNRKRNVHYKSTMKTAVKSALVAIEEKSENAGELVRKAAQYIDKLVSKGILHKKTAGNKKSRLMSNASKAKVNIAAKKAAPKKAAAATAEKKETKTTAAKKPAAKKPAAKKATTAKKPAAKKTPAKKTTVAKTEK